jgi:hypothetical protein
MFLRLLCVGNKDGILGVLIRDIPPLIRGAIILDPGGMVVTQPTQD